MRLTIIALVLCVCVWFSAGDVTHLKAAKTKLIGRLARGKHHKRGVLTAVPPYKLGYDIPVVTHSVVKPLVVSYPPAAAVTAVKVPLAHPLTTRYPVPVGHKVPVPHPHYGLKFPHHQKTVLYPKPDHHFHHHHHHVAPKPVIPVVPAPVPVPATPVVPFAAPTATVAHPVPVPSPPVLLQPSIHAPAPAHIFPAPTVAHTHLFPQEHVHLKPAVPAAPLPVQPAPAVSPFASLLPYANQFPYILRPGNAVQTSYFASYPRYPLFNFQSPIIPFAQPAPAVSQVLYERPQVPHLHLVPQAGQDGVVIEQQGHVEPSFLHAHGEIPQPAVHLQPTQPTLHLQPTPGVHFQPDVHLQHDGHLHPSQPEIHLHQGQPEVHLHAGQPDIHLHSAQPGILHAGPEVHLQSAQPGILPTQPTVHLQPTQPTVDQDGWHPVQSQPHDIAAGQSGVHFGQDAQFGQGAHFGQDAHHQFTQEQGTQVYEHHTGDQQYNDFQNQLQHHLQQQLEQAQYEQHINKQQHQLGQEYGAPQLGQDFGHSDQDFSQHGQDFNQQGQNFGQGHDFNQQGQHFGQDFSQHGQNFGQDFNQQQPAAEYGVPQGAEGRSSAEGEEEPQFHNHIPLKLQPPIDRPLEHFR